MGVAKHSIQTLDPTASPESNKSIIGQQFSVANAAGGGAGAAVATVVTFTEPLPENYNVHVEVRQDAVAFVGTRTAFGFTVTLNPRLAANTLASGTFGVTVMAA